MLLHVNNEMENGIIAKIPLALDKDVKGFQGDAIDFEISSPDRQLIQADDFHPYKSLFKVLSGTSELKNIYIALSFNLSFSTPDGKNYNVSLQSNRGLVNHERGILFGEYNLIRLYIEQQIRRLLWRQHHKSLSLRD